MFGWLESDINAVVPSRYGGGHLQSVGGREERERAVVVVFVASQQMQPYAVVVDVMRPRWKRGEGREEDHRRRVVTLLAGVEEAGGRSPCK